MHTTPASSDPSTDELLADWQLWQQSQSLSHRTISERAFVIRHLLTTTGNGPLELKPNDIVRFTARQDISATSRATYHATIRAFCAWLVQVELRDDDPSKKTPRPKRPRAQPRPITSSALVDTLNRVNRRRTRMMILLAAFAGLRVHEIAKFRGDDLDRVNGTMTIDGKGGKVATIPAHAVILAEASTFPRNGPWFPAYAAQSDREHITAAAVSKAIMDTMKRAGHPTKAHQLRHWYGTSLLGEGVDVRVVQTLMRHENLSTTALYTLVHQDQQMAGIAQLRTPGGTWLRPETLAA